MHRLFSHRSLVFLGQHSLQVFAFHMLVVYLIDILFEDRVLSPVLANACLLLCVVSLYFPAWLHSKVQARQLRDVAGKVVKVVN